MLIIKIKESDYQYASTFRLQFSEMKDITGLPDYDLITHMDFSNNNLTKLPIKLPKILEYLNCHRNNIRKLPELPDTLTTLICSNNKLTELSELPNKMSELVCNNNNIVNFPKLPDTIYEFHCDSRPLFNLDHLPNALIILSINKYIIFGSKITKLKKLNDIRKLNAVKKISYWFLECKYNPKYKYCRDRLMNEYNEYNEINELNELNELNECCQ